MTEQKMLRPHHAAKRLDVCTETVKRWLRSGRLRGVRLPGGRWRIPEREILDLVQEIATNRNR